MENEEKTLSEWWFAQGTIKGGFLRKKKRWEERIWIEVQD
jgi:hypothetical protein